MWNRIFRARKSLIIVLCLAIILGVFWNDIKAPLTQGMQPIASHQIVAEKPLPDKDVLQSQSQSIQIKSHHNSHDSLTVEVAYVDTLEMQSPLSKMYNSENISVSVNQLIEQYGWDDPHARAAIGEVIEFCASDHDITGGMAESEYKDKSRAWAYKKMLDACGEFKAIETLDQLQKTANESNDTMHILHNAVMYGSNSDKILAAAQLVKSSTDRVALANAVGMLERRDAQFIENLIPQADEIGEEVMDNAIDMAAQMAACSLNGGCGSYSIPTLSVCMAAGCREGVTYQEALQQNLSPREYEATMAFYNWIMRQRADNR